MKYTRLLYLVCFVFLYSKMTAYRKSHSCETTFRGLIEDWKLAVDSKQPVYVLSTDMSIRPSTV